MSSRSLSPGFFDPRNYQDGRDDENETLEVVVPQNAMEAASPNALVSMIAWWFAASPGCKCGGGGRQGITKIYTY
jgi:hypothetical protein